MPSRTTEFDIPDIKMDKVINLEIPHVGEQIFEALTTDDLIQCLQVSQTWKVPAETVLLTRWKGKMYEACKNGKKEIVNLLLERCSFEENGLNDAQEIHENYTPPMIACVRGHKDVVQLLLENPHRRKINWNKENHFKKTAFIQACRYGREDVVQLLLDHLDININVNATDWFQQTGPMYACENGHAEVVRLLLNDSRYDIDWNFKHPDSLDRTAFMEACIVDFHALNVYGENALTKPCERGDCLDSTTCRHITVVKLMLKFAKTKNIEIPRRIDNCYKVISDLIDKHYDTIELIERISTLKRGLTMKRATEDTEMGSTTRYYFSEKMSLQRKLRRILDEVKAMDGPNFALIIACIFVIIIGGIPLYVHFLLKYYNQT